MASVVVISVALFFAAALFEIGGGYLVWLWLREKRGVMLGVIGAVVLFVYGVVPTLQPSHFSRVYAAYGGIFIAASIVWGLIVDKKRPDRYELVGAAIALVGALVIMYFPR